MSDFAAHQSIVQSSSPGSSGGSRLGSSRVQVKVVTAPPWAREEPPSPADSDEHKEIVNSSVVVRSSISRQTGSSDALSFASTTQPQIYDRRNNGWWTFNKRAHKDVHTSEPRNPRLPRRPNFYSISSMPGKRARLFKEKSKTWISQRLEPKEDQYEDERLSDRDVEGQNEVGNNAWDFDIPLPSASFPFTLAHARTPGWDTPWSPQVLSSGAHPTGDHFDTMNGGGDAREMSNSIKDEAQDSLNTKSLWYRRRRRLRLFILNNNYVPLIFRIFNTSLTAAALAVAIKIRIIESRFNIRGAVGSSPTLVIIFAPLTLIHVMTAIYLEYFGRPLGLWRTSMKLAHTLSDTLLICAWSAALSLCFDNFFTAIIGCASPSAISWYSQIDRPVPNLPNLGRHEGGTADQICNRQLALICLVGVGLIMYYMNLVISLFRIFEKVKYHPPVTGKFSAT